MGGVDAADSYGAVRCVALRWTGPEDDARGSLPTLAWAAAVHRVLTRVHPIPQIIGLRSLAPANGGHPRASCSSAHHVTSGAWARLQSQRSSAFAPPGPPRPSPQVVPVYQAAPSGDRQHKMISLKAARLNSHNYMACDIPRPHRWQSCWNCN